MLHHLPCNVRQQCAREICRLLKPQGACLPSTSESLKASQAFSRTFIVTVTSIHERSSHCSTRRDSAVSRAAPSVSVAFNSCWPRGGVTREAHKPHVHAWPALLAAVLVLLIAHADLLGFAIRVHWSVALVAGLAGTLLLKRHGGGLGVDGSARSRYRHGIRGSCIQGTDALFAGAAGFEPAAPCAQVPRPATPCKRLRHSIR